MFFVSEEFLRRMEEGEEAVSSALGEGGGPGEDLFPEEKYAGAERKSQRGPAKPKKR